MKQDMKYKNVKKIAVHALTLAFTVLLCTSAYATGDLESTKLVTGTKELLAAGTTVITGLALAITVFFGVKNGMAWQAADDQQKPAAKKKVLMDVAIGIVTLCIGGVITAIFAFYQ